MPVKLSLEFHFHRCQFRLQSISVLLAHATGTSIQDYLEVPMPEPVVAVYDNHSAAEEAVAKLSAASFDIKQISIIGKDYHTQENVVGYYTTGDRLKSVPRQKPNGHMTSWLTPSQSASGGTKPSPRKKSRMLAFRARPGFKIAAG
jgi:hypothetical protein